MPSLALVTGFFIPTATRRPSRPTARSAPSSWSARCAACGYPVCHSDVNPVCRPCTSSAGVDGRDRITHVTGPIVAIDRRPGSVTHTVAIERAGPAADGRCYTMRGRDITEHRCDPAIRLLRDVRDTLTATVTIGIGDGGNEIGMGKIPHETIVKNIPNGDLIHCRVPTDHLIVAGVSNWGAYALAAGVYVLRGVKPPADLFDPDREREILEVMVREGPLVDGVTGKQTATVDGLTWDEYAKPLIRIREILES